MVQASAALQPCAREFPFLMNLPKYVLVLTMLPCYASAVKPIGPGLHGQPGEVTLANPANVFFLAD